MKPLFTQKHYECLIEKLRPLRPEIALKLCSIFKADNPKFDADKFNRMIQSPDGGGTHGNTGEDPNRRMHDALEALHKAVGETGWHSCDPRVSERRRRTELMNAARAAIKETA